MQDPEELLHKELTERIISCYYNVYNELGPGHLESVYEEAMQIALDERGVHAQRQVPVPVWFHGKRIGDFRADMLVEGKVILELKTARAIDLAHQAQLMHYLKATQIEVGLLLNFGEHPAFRRIVFSNERKKIRGNPRKSAVGVS